MKTLQKVITALFAITVVMCSIQNGKASDNCGLQPNTNQLTEAKCGQTQADASCPACQ